MHNRERRGKGKAWQSHVSRPRTVRALHLFSSAFSFLSLAISFSVLFLPSYLPLSLPVSLTSCLPISLSLSVSSSPHLPSSITWQVRGHLLLRSNWKSRKINWVTVMAQRLRVYPGQLLFWWGLLWDANSFRASGCPCQSIQDLTQLRSPLGHKGTCVWSKKQLPFLGILQQSGEVESMTEGAQDGHHPHWPKALSNLNQKLMATWNMGCKQYVLYLWSVCIHVLKHVEVRGNGLGSWVSLSTLF